MEQEQEHMARPVVALADLVVPQRHHRSCHVFLFLFHFLLALIPYERSLLDRKSVV